MPSIYYNTVLFKFLELLHGFNQNEQVDARFAL